MTAAATLNPPILCLVKPRLISPSYYSPQRLRQCCAAPQSQSQSHQSENGSDVESPPLDPPAIPRPPRKSSAADTTDWIASSLTRRFGLGAGLAWVGFLAFGVISEQIKTRTEVFLEEQGTRDVEAEEIVLPSKVRYVDLRVGGGASLHSGDLVVVDLVGRVAGGGQTFVDTMSGPKKRPIALVFGRRPYVGGMCQGLEHALQSMRVGGKRKVVVPPELGFGASGEDLGGGVPPNATLEYTVQLLRASIAPS